MNNQLEYLKDLKNRYQQGLKGAGYKVIVSYMDDNEFLEVIKNILQNIQNGSMLNCFFC